MININCERDKNGFFDIGKLDMTNHSISFGRVSETKASANFWVHREGAPSFLVKHRDFPVTIFALYAELIYAEICKKNNVKCANVDAGKFDGHICVLSEDVSVNADERFDCYGLACLSGISHEEVFADSGKDFRKNFYADKLYYFATKIERESRGGLMVDKDFLIDLYKLGVMDLLLCQEDRNPTNIMFLIDRDEKGKRVLRVAPTFDNEFSLGLLRLGALYQHFQVNPFEKKRENDFMIESVLSDECREVTKYVTPIFGTRERVERFSFPISSDCENLRFENERKKTKEILNSEFKNMAIVALSNPEIYSFIKNFDANIFEIGETLKKQTGIKIPEIYLDSCEDVVRRNLERLKARIEKMEKCIVKKEEKSEKGE